jgi:hypothetical protein
MEIKVYLSSPDAIRKLAEVLELEQASYPEPRGVVATIEGVAQKLGHAVGKQTMVEAAVSGVVDHVIPGVSTTQGNPLGNESSAFATTAPKKRGRPPKNPEANVETPDPEILPGAPAPVPVNPVVTMPNGVVLNAPVETPTASAAAPAPAELPTLAQVVADYAKAFQIAGLSALAKREGVTKFSELPEDRQATLKREMLDAISLGVAAA